MTKAATKLRPQLEARSIEDRDDILRLLLDMRKEELELDRAIGIIAVAHSARRPGYWKGQELK
jgi:hypothetical protein